MPGSVIEPHAGLTIIYGENGTGKTGYARILKALAKSRTDGEILGDVSVEASSTPSATIAYTLGDEKKELQWRGEHGVVPFTACRSSTLRPSPTTLMPTWNTSLCHRSGALRPRKRGHSGRSDSDRGPHLIASVWVIRIYSIASRATRRSTRKSRRWELRLTLRHCSPKLIRTRRSRIASARSGKQSPHSRATASPPSSERASAKSVSLVKPRRWRAASWP